MFPFDHLNDPIPCVKGNEILLFDSFTELGVPGSLSLGLLFARTLAWADAVGAM